MSLLTRSMIISTAFLIVVFNTALAQVKSINGILKPLMTAKAIDNRLGTNLNSRQNGAGFGYVIGNNTPENDRLTILDLTPIGGTIGLDGKKELVACFIMYRKEFSQWSMKEQESWTAGFLRSYRDLTGEDFYFAGGYKWIAVSPYGDTLTVDFSYPKDLVYVSYLGPSGNSGVQSSKNSQTQDKDVHSTTKKVPPQKASFRFHVFDVLTGNAIRNAEIEIAYRRDEPYSSGLNHEGKAPNPFVFDGVNYRLTTNFPHKVTYSFWVEAPGYSYVSVKVIDPKSQEFVADRRQFAYGGDIFVGMVPSDSEYRYLLASSCRDMVQKLNRKRYKEAATAITRKFENCY